MAVYDDQQTRPESKELDDLNQLTGISPAEERAMEDRAITDDMAERNQLNDRTGGDDKRDKPGSDSSDDNEIPYNAGKGKRKKGFRLTKKQGITGGIVGLLLGGGFFAMTLTQPLQLLQLDFTLGKHESAHTNIVSKRMRRMFYRATLRNADDRLVLSRSRLGAVQNRVFGSMLDRLEQQGIIFEETTGPATGNSRPTVTFDLPQDSPLRGSTGEQTRLNIAREFGIDRTKVGGSSDNGRFTIRQLDLTPKEIDGFKNGLAKHAGGGRVSGKFNPKVAVSMNKRLFSKTLRLPSLFHPVSRASESAGRRIDSFVEARRERKKTNAERTRRSTRVNQRVSNARSALSSRTGSNLMTTAGAAVAVQGVMCMVRDIAEIIPGVYYATVVMPAMIRSIQTQSTASQMRSGQNISSQVLGDLVSDLSDGDGRSVWGAKSVNALANGGPGTGTDIDVGARSAFTTTGSSIRGLTTALGFDEATGVEVADSVSGWACSSPARVAGIFAGIGLTAAGIVGGVFTYGTTTAGAVGRVAAQATLATAISYTASRILGEFVDGQIRGKVSDVCGVEYDSGDSGEPEDIEILNAEAYGNCLAYASRMSSNINAAAMGGVPLSNTDERALINQMNEQEIANFKQKNLPQRLFGTTEKRSLLMAAMRPAMSSGFIGGRNSLASIFSSALKLPVNVASGLSSLISPKTYAQSDSYDWGFPLVSMPSSVVENPEYDSPEIVRWITENRESIDEGRVRDCFGVEIVGEGSGLRTAILDEEINPLSDEYNDADCGDLDPEWTRTALFVMDDSIARTMDCYDGNSQACVEIGMSGQMTASTPQQAAPGAAIVGNTSDTPCAPGTNDLGEETGYSRGSAYRIRLCAIPGFISSQEEGNGNLVRVNSTVSANWLELYTRAQTQGINLRAHGSFRSNERQAYFWNCFQTRSCNGGRLAARPGHSNHQMGFSVDLVMDGSNLSVPQCEARRSSYPIYNFLASTAPGLGIQSDVNSECWHWTAR